MNNQTIADIYRRNDTIQHELIETISNLPDERASVSHDGEKWTIAEFVEHIAIVEDGITKISARLLGAAKAAGNNNSDGKAIFSESFAQKASEAKSLKFEAPDRVRPTGKQTIAESLAKMERARAELETLRPLFETLQLSGETFPHPFMGDLTAHEWLALVGGHKARHLEQIKNIIAKMSA